MQTFQRNAPSGPVHQSAVIGESFTPSACPARSGSRAPA